jgi:hypothetical protein
VIWIAGGRSRREQTERGEKRRRERIVCAHVAAPLTPHTEAAWTPTGERWQLWVAASK